MQTSIKAMTEAICSILKDSIVSIYLHGSVALNDFQPGWSDIDIVCLTDRVISDTQAEQLLYLRSVLLANSKDNTYYRSFEGIITSLDEFKNNKYSKVVYWGTSGEKITNDFYFDTFSLFSLIKYGKLLFGKDIRAELQIPSYSQLKSAVKNHYETIRKYAVKTSLSIYSCGWLLDIARCIYTLQTGDIISKTHAGKWAIQNHLCPDENQMIKALKIRQSPLVYKNNEDVNIWLASLGPVIQEFADVLDTEIKKYTSKKLLTNS